jgi:hypothetical protein
VLQTGGRPPRLGVSRLHHRIGNSGDQPIHVLELAFGHFDEGDIERLEDDYERASTAATAH